MLYGEARAQIKSGDLIAFANDGWLSWLIRTGTGGSYSHVGIAFVLSERCFVLSAQEQTGVTLLPLSRKAPFYWISLPVVWNETVQIAALDKLGLPYSYFDAALAAMGRKLCHPDEVCSGYAQEILQQLGLPLVRPSYTPSSLVATVLDSTGASLHKVVPDLITALRRA